jgi:hypothetical protein
LQGNFFVYKCFFCRIFHFPTFSLPT